MEGIETNHSLHTAYEAHVSVGAPTWRGLKQHSMLVRLLVVLVSVGAPTWRGLKLVNRCRFLLRS